MRKIRFARMFAAMALLGAACHAQTVTGMLQGRVSDSTGAAVPGAGVQAREVTTAISRSGKTNAEGFYQFAFLPLGRYEVTVEFSGFQNQSRTAAVELNRTTVVDFTLAVSAVQQEVTVSEAAPLVDTASGQVRRSLNEGLINAIPVGGRSFLNLAPLLPGFQTNPTSGQNNFTLSSGSSASFNGTGTRSTTFQTDGVANDDASENQHRQGVNLSTIKEFQVLTNSFSAEFGRGAGAVVLIQTKSGTNQTHGESYWLTTNSALNARGYFANAAGSRVDPATGRLTPNVPKPSSKTHRPGGAVGGKIISDKLFYFASYERFWAPGAVSSTVTLLPKEFRTPRVDPQLPDAAERRAWVQSIVDRFPDVEPNNTVNNPYGYSASVGRTNQSNDLSGRLDYNLSERDILYGRYQFSDALIKTDEIVRGTNAKQDHRFQNVGLTWTHVYTPRVTGEFRFGFGRRRMIVSLNDGDDVPIVRWNIAFAPSGTGNASQFPLKRFQNDFQYVYNLNWQAGSRHTLKFGTDSRRIQLNDRLENIHRGWWTFSSAPPFNALETFARGVVQTYQQGFGPKINGNRFTDLSFYAQDSWRAAPGLTLEIGARLEYAGKPTEVNGLVDLGYGADAYVEPRFGFAYSLPWKSGLLGKMAGGPGSSVIRGGFGIYHGRVFQSIFSQVGAAARFNPPNGATVTRQDPDMSVVRPLGGFVFQPGPAAAQTALTLADPGLRMPYTTQWNLTLERALPRRSALSISYVGNRGVGMLQYDWSNRARFPVVSSVPAHYPGTGNFPGVLLDKIDSNLFNTNPAPGFISLAQPRTAARRADGRFGAFLRASNNAWSYYHSLQTQYTKRLSDGLALQAYYTWSRNIDTGTEATFVGTGDINALISETQGARGNRGLSRLDQPHRFVLSYSYELPLQREQRGVLGRLLGGWNVNGITTLAAGNPVTVFLGYDLNGDGIGGDRPWLVDPLVHGKSFDNARINPATGVQYSQERITPAAFLPDASAAATRQWPWFPGSGLVASAGRNIFRLHGQNNFDAAFVKKTRLGGRDKPHILEFRAEMFNLFNRVMFDFPNLSLVDTGVPGYRINPLFGRITSQRNGSRSMQMMLRYQF